MLFAPIWFMYMKMFPMCFHRSHKTKRKRKKFNRKCIKREKFLWKSIFLCWNDDDSKRKFANSWESYLWPRLWVENFLLLGELSHTMGRSLSEWSSMKASHSLQKVSTKDLLLVPESSWAEHVSRRERNFNFLTRKHQKSFFLFSVEDTQRWMPFKIAFWSLKISFKWNTIALRLLETSAEDEEGGRHSAVRSLFPLHSCHKNKSNPQWRLS